MRTISGLVAAQMHGASGCTAASSCCPRTSSGRSNVPWLVSVALRNNLACAWTDIVVG
ncbi:hypothetical protein BDU57DRAFT_523485 [Ampelomyces quisqualis]|uniref:Uncharacterized protein n=1 Tax=Ampelomyces quisqualis TaxID=50730 RepID=A0A6A5Q9K5_AMPQU|nr:hypothetical protein BDU57DRAFT_523485 [Ampelomyces quisqualis]